MDFINIVMEWLEANWGVTIFGGVSVGLVVTTTVLLVKQWLGNTRLGKSFSNAFAAFDEKYSRLEALYTKSLEENKSANAQLLIAQQATAVIFDGTAKLVLASKLDSEDKQAFIASVERYKLMKPAEVVQDLKDKATNVVTTVADQKPEQTIVDVAANTLNLLDKYAKPKGE